MGRNNAPDPTPDDILADIAEQQRAERLDKERLDARRRAEILELRRLTSALQVKSDMLRTIAEHAPLLTPPKLTLHGGNGKRPRHVWVLVLSDLQHGQKSSLGGSGQIFEQSSAISTQQFRLLWQRIDELARIASKSKEITEFWILDLGDMHEGDSMRVSQAMKVDSPVTVQCIEVVDLESELINNALARFPRVRVRKVGGNHDRVSSKPGTAGLGEMSMLDTFSWLGGEFLKRLHKRAIEGGRLEFVNHESWFGGSQIAGLRCVYEHGASFKAGTGSYGGVGYYGIANAAAGYQRMLDGADLVLFGHFHTPMILPMNGGRGWQIVNGAFPPSSEYAQSSFKVVGRPTQWLLDLHEEHGLVEARPIYLELDSQMRPGDFWRSISERDAPESAA